MADSPGNRVELAMTLLERMTRIRFVEERLHQLFSDGEIPGFLHLSVGQEAIPVGLCVALRDTDTLASNHRGHGHALAKGIPLDSFFLELMAKADGICGGRGGSMHVADFGVGMLGANGIVGAGIPMAVGSALAHQLQGRGGIAVAIFGDGALAEGVLHESFNIAALWGLPILFVCENNGWSEFSPTSRQFNAPVTKIAETFSMEGVTVDGNDVFAVMEAAERLVEAARSGEPKVLECITSRVHGHYIGDAQKYRLETEIAEALTKDPIVRLEDWLAGNGVDRRSIGEMRESVTAEIEGAVERARNAGLPVFTDAAAAVYAPAHRRAA